MIVPHFSISLLLSGQSEPNLSIWHCLWINLYECVQLENHKVDKGYAEVLLGEDEVAVAVSPSGTAHALVNVDPVRSTFFIGCQDSDLQNNSSTSDYKVWKDL